MTTPLFDEIEAALKYYAFHPHHHAPAKAALTRLREERKKVPVYLGDALLEANLFEQKIVDPNYYAVILEGGRLLGSMNGDMK